MRKTNEMTTVGWVKRIGGGLLTWLMAVQTFEWVWSKLDIVSPELAWAFTVCTGALALYVLALMCTFQSSVLKDEVERCAAAKSQLEQQVLKSRRSSKRRQKQG